MSFLQSINSCCAESVSQNSNIKEADKPSEEVGPAQKFKLNNIDCIFNNDIKPALVREWSFYKDLNCEEKSLHFYCFGNCQGYAERGVKLNADGQWCLFVEGIQREVALEWTDCPQPVKTFGDIVYLLNQVGKFTVCHGCDYQKYESFVPSDSEFGKPVFMTRW